MNNDDMFMNSLADFRDLKVKHDNDNSINQMNHSHHTPTSP